MLPIIIFTPRQIKVQIAKQAKQRRLDLDFSRKTLALKSGVPDSTIKRFETTGNISLDALLKIALVLDGLDEFGKLFERKPPISLSKPIFSERQRGRK